MLLSIVDVHILRFVVHTEFLPSMDLHEVAYSDKVEIDVPDTVL